MVARAFYISEIEGWKWFTYEPLNNKHDVRTRFACNRRINGSV